jgi:hypothetical protein
MLMYFAFLEVFMIQSLISFRFEYIEDNRLAYILYLYKYNMLPLILLNHIRSYSRSK